MIDLPLIGCIKNKQTLCDASLITPFAWQIACASHYILLIQATHTKLSEVIPKRNTMIHRFFSTGF
jgi:hypothetical protein